MDEGYLEKAELNRQRQTIIRPDMRELTDESKEELRRKSRETRIREPMREPEYNPLTHRFKFF